MNSSENINESDNNTYIKKIRNHYNRCLGRYNEGSPKVSPEEANFSAINMIKNFLDTKQTEHLKLLYKLVLANEILQAQNYSQKVWKQKFNF